MKRIYSFLGAAMMLLAVSCTDKDEFGLSEFVVNTEFQQADNGAKVNFTADGLWWDQGGDYLYINGTAVSLVWDGEVWKTTEGALIDSENNYFNVIYKGGAGINDGVGYSDGVYTDVDFTNTIPLAAQTNNNNITLYPCCAVLRIPSASTVFVTIGNDDGGVCTSSGSINCGSRSISADPEAELIQDYSADPVNGTAYVVIPIVGESFTATYLDITNATATLSLSLGLSSVTLNKGFIYNVSIPE